MNHSKLYVPNPQRWVDFFDKVAKGKVEVNQKGGGGSGFMQIVPADRKDTSPNRKPEVPVKFISATEQLVEQAKSELERKDIKPSEVKEMFQKANSARRQRKYKPKAKRQSKKGQGGKSKKKKATANRKRKLPTATSKSKKDVFYNF